MLFVEIGRKQDCTVDVAVAAVKVWLRKRMGRTCVRVGSWHGRIGGLNYYRSRKWGA